MTLDHRGLPECPADCIGGVRVCAADIIEACPICDLARNSGRAAGIVRALLRALDGERRRSGKSVEYTLAAFVAFGEGIGHDLAVIEKEEAQERVDDLEMALSALVAEVEAALPKPKRKGLKVALVAARKVLDE